VIVALALVVGLQLFLTARDKAGVDSGGASGATGPGRRLPDQGNRHLAAGDPTPHYASEPPASGPHRVSPVGRAGAALSDDQVLTALEAGNVLLLTAGPAPDRLRAVPPALHARFTPGLARAGQAVILGRRRGVRGVLALAWRHELEVAGPGDPRLRGFADAWLGIGAPR
jgi:hypothetical protein